MGLILYMKPKNKPTNNDLVFELFKFFVDSRNKKIYLNKDINPSLIYLMEEILTDSYQFIYYDDELLFCPKCGEQLSLNGTQKFSLNKKLIIGKQKYICPNKKCQFTIITHPNQYIDKYCNYTKEIKEKAVKYSLIQYSSYQNKAEYINLHYRTKISRQTIYNANNTLIDQILHQKEQKLSEKIKKLNIKSSGIYCYDEEFIKINKSIYVRMTIIDYKTKIIINDQIIPKNQFQQKTIQKFLKESLKGLKINTIITDGYKVYEDIIKDLGAKHQKCVFHIMQNLMTPLQKKINKNTKKIKHQENSINKKKNKIKELKTKIPNKRGRIKKTDTKTIKIRNQINKIEIEINNEKFEKRKLKKENKEYNKYKEKISLIFKSKKHKTAIKRFNNIMSQINQLPKIIQIFLKNLEKKIDYTLNHTKNREIPKTNNLIELIYRTTFPGKIKRIFRTLKGAKRQIKSNNIKWMENNVLEFKKKFIS